MACNGDKFITLFCAQCGSEHKVQVNCGDRTCVSCRKREFERLKKKYLPMMKILDSSRLVFVTLTRRIRPGAGAVGLKHRIEETRKAFNDLLRQRVFKTIAGGFYSIEVKWSEKYKGWNVHLHAVCEIISGAVRKVWVDKKGRGKNKGRFKADVISLISTLTIQGLRRSWLRLTDDSDRVDITPVLDRFGGVNGVLAYILKYLSKPAEVGENAEIYNQGLKGHRMIHAFGSWYLNCKNYRFKDVPKPQKEPLVCDSCSNLYWISEFDVFKAMKRAVEEPQMKRQRVQIFGGWGGVIYAGEDDLF